MTYQNRAGEDITTRYMDTEARLASLTAQRTRLQELQAQADTLADLLEIESSLSDVLYQIESWQSQLDWYSNQVSCCTVYITLNEVETLTPTSTSFGAKLLAACAMAGPASYPVHSRGGVPCGRMARHPHRRGLRRDLLPCPPSQKEKVKKLFQKPLTSTRLCGIILEQPANS